MPKLTFFLVAMKKYFVKKLFADTFYTDLPNLTLNNHVQKVYFIEVNKH